MGNEVTPQSAYFVLGMPDHARVGAGRDISQAQVFFDEDHAVASVDEHYELARSNTSEHVLAATEWFVLTALIGDGLGPAYGEHFLTYRTDDVLWAIAGGFTRPEEMTDWLPFIFAAEDLHDHWSPGGVEHGLVPSSAKRTDTIDLSRLWFAPVMSQRVYPVRAR
ncbi:hypothetical protein KXR83_21320 [Williamsia muralis]|uniref:hypothetical protein n=1 Tax=Williamsia marianensis TaxID=85044 RepID=UPI003F18B074